MSQRKLSVEVNKFNKGLVGSASPVDFPIDAASVMKNFIIEKDGSLRKRGGLYRAHYYTTTSNNIVQRPDGRTYGFIKNPSGSDGSLLVTDVRRGNISPTSQVFYLESGTELMERCPVVDEISLAPAALYTSISSSSYANGSWYVTKRDNGTTVQSIRSRFNPISKVVYVEDSAFKTVTVRDSWGAYPDVEDSIEYPISGVPASTVLAARYNAQNRGFRLDYYFASSGVSPDTFDTFGIPGRGYSPRLTYDTGNRYVYFKQPTLLTPAPSGNVILNWMEFDRRLVIPAGTPTTIGGETEESLPASSWSGSDVYSTSWGGRIFYWSVGASPDSADGSVPDANTPNPNTMILFSQVLTSGDAHRNCHSFNSPTAGVSAEGLLAYNAQPTEADGGVIVIDGTGDIISLVPFANSLVVFAENGIWEVTGPFSPINYGVNKVSEVRCVDMKSIVVLESQVVFMGDNSINAVKLDLRSRSLFVEDISTASLSDIYLDRYKFDSSNSNNWSAYNSEDGVVQWATVDRPSFFSQGTVKILCFDVALSAFYEKEFILPPMTLLTGMYDDPIRERGIVYVIESYISNGGFGNAEVGLYFEGTGLTDDITYYRLIDLQKLTANNPVVAELETGAASFGDASKSKNAPYISLYFKQTEGSYDAGGNFDKPTSCLMRLKWDFSRSADTGKWTDEKEMYRLKRFNYPDTPTFDYGYDVIVTKNKIRGRGKALRIKLTVPAGKTCHLYGWNFTLMANSEV